MDIFLGRVTSQAMNYAIRSGVTISATYAIKQCGRLLQNTPRSERREELIRLQRRLESKIRIISPAIDMIDLISARGNTTLESAVSLTKEIRYEIQRLGTRLSAAANDEELLRRNSSRAKTREQTERELAGIITSIQYLLNRIEDAVPLISLAITTSGVNLSSKLSGSISPSRLLQASTFLSAADSKYTAQPGRRQQVGPTYTLSLYMLFAGHAFRANDEALREMTWKEVMHKARVKIVRVPLEYLNEISPSKRARGLGAQSIPGEGESMEFAYQIVIIEDLDDDRVHTFEDGEQQPGPFEDVASAGMRHVVPVHEISKVFYADTGKILNMGRDESDINNPVLLLKRDTQAEPPRRMMQRSQVSAYDLLDESLVNESYTNGSHTADDQSEIDDQLHRESLPNTPLKEQTPPLPRDTGSGWKLPADLDPEWMAFEVFAEDNDTSSESDDVEDTESPEPPRPARDSLSGALSSLKLGSPSPKSSPSLKDRQLIRRPHPQQKSNKGLPPIKTSLSLLEMLLKLTALQQFRQESHLSIEDELLNFFLEDTSTAGTNLDKQGRQRARNQAVRSVGFDPYDESPMKKRGEEYIRRTARPFDENAFRGRLANGYDGNDDDEYEHEK